MTTAALYRVLRRHCRCAADDADLLARFARHRDEAAFDEILRRHGPMVRAVCRRVLGPTADTDDAFQATFLVLVRRANSVRRGDQLANWLCAVAYRTANQARRRRLRTGSREQQVERLPEAGYESAPPRDWLPLFDAALQRLPDKFREPLVLCELQGHSRADAARLLGVNENTLSSRLARGRELLRKRLGHLGFPLSVGAALFPVAVPDALAEATARYATAFSQSMIPETILQLTNGVIQTMLPSKLKYVAVALVGILMATGIGVRTNGPKVGATPADPPPAAKPAPEPVKAEFWFPKKGADSTAVTPEQKQRLADRPPLALAEPVARTEVANKDVIVVSSKQFRISVNCDPVKIKQIREILLLLSSDNGKTWQLHSRGGVDTKWFDFVAPANGIYWFAVVTSDTNGHWDPPGLENLQPNLKVKVEQVKLGPILQTSEPTREAVELQLRREIADLRKRLDELEKRLPEMKR